MIDAKRSLVVVEDVLRLIADLPHTGHMPRQQSDLDRLYNQLEGDAPERNSAWRQCVVSFGRLEFFGEVMTENNSFLHSCIESSG